MNTEQERAAVEADRQHRGEPVGETFTMEPLDGSGDVRSHALLTRDLPAGTKLYAAPPVSRAIRPRPAVPLRPACRRIEGES